MVLIFGLQAFASPETQMNTWKSLVDNGQSKENERPKSVQSYIQAAQLYEQAANYAQQNRLPDRCFEMALCRQTAAEVLANSIARANADCDKLMPLIGREKANNTLDPELEVWVLNLANAYQAHTEPRTREQCLLKLSQINKVLLGDKHREYKMGQAMLGKYYQNNQADQTSQLKAAQIQITADEDGLKQAELASDPFRKGYFLNDLSSRYITTGQLDRAKAADLELVKMAKGYTQIADGLVGYYASLGSIEFAQGNVSQGKTYFDLAVKQAAKIKGNKQKVAIAVVTLDALTKSVKSDKTNASTELKELLSVQETVSSDPRGQYTVHRQLASALDQAKQFDDADRHLQRAIDIANLPNSMVKKDVPALYTQLAMSQIARGQNAKANETFVKALAELPDKTGFDATRILVFWGGLALQHNDLRFAYEKLSTAAKQAEALPKATRGTLLIDSLYAMCMINIREKNLKANQENMAKLRPEIKDQQALNSNIGPNFWGKFQRDKFSW